MDNHGLASDHGFLPSNPLEREIMRSVVGIEDEDGKKSGMLRQDDEDMKCHRQVRYNTAAKGVMEDASRAYAMFALQQQADKVRTRVMNQKMAGKGAMTAVEQAAADSDEFDDDEFEDEEFHRYKLERLKQMQKHAAASAALPTFGKLEETEVLEYPGKVDAAGPTSFCVVHLKEDYLACCAELTEKFEQLADKYDQVRFLNVCASEAMETLEPTKLPCVIVYHGGEFVSVEYCVGKAEGAQLSLEHVEEVLLRMGCRLTTSTVMREADRAALDRLKEWGFEESFGVGRRVGAKNGSDEEDEDEDENND